MPRITVQVEDRAGNIQGSGPITTAFGLRYNRPLNEAGRFSFLVPKRDPRNLWPTMKTRVVRIFLDNDQVFLGIVEKRTNEITDAGIAAVRIEGRDMTAELAEQFVGTELDLSSGGAGVTNAPSLILAVLPMTNAWALDSGTGKYATTTNSVYGTLHGESKLRALQMAHELTGESWRYGDGDREISWLRGEAGFQASGVRAISGSHDPVALEDNPDICLIRRLRVIVDGHEAVKQVHPYGSGQGDDRLDIKATTHSNPSGNFGIDKASNRVTYQPAGYSFASLDMVTALQFREIRPISNTDGHLQEAADMLVEATMRWLERYAEAQVFYELEVYKLPSTVLPGTTVDVIYYEEDVEGTVVHDIDATLNVLDIHTVVSDDGAQSHRLLVSDTDRMPITDGREMVSRIREGQLFQVHPQRGPVTYRESFREHVGDHQTNEIGEIEWWFNNSVSQVHRVLWRFKLEELVSTVNTVSGSSTTSDSGGASTPTSGASSASSSGSSSEPGTTSAQNTDHDHNETGTVTGIQNQSHSHDFTTPAHSHTIAHTHDVTISSHTHTLTPNLSTTYGVFRESGANTLAAADLEFRVNGGTWTALTSGPSYTSHGNDWYSIDITHDSGGWTDGVIKPSTNAAPLRPVQENNKIEVRCDAGAAGSNKHVMVKGAIEIDAILQSVALS